jgi:hypothetical protein
MTWYLSEHGLRGLLMQMYQLLQLRRAREALLHQESENQLALSRL